jgi:hypothetical protein
VDDGFLGRVENVEEVINVKPAVEKVADVELLEIFVAVELFVVGVGVPFRPILSRFAAGLCFRRSVF